MTTYVGSDEAARLLSISKPTLYAYVSRGIVSRTTAVDGRTSLFALDELERLSTRSPRRTPRARPTIDVQIVSAITTLDETAPRYRDRAITSLVACSYEQVAELLWTGVLPDDTSWPPPAAGDRRACRRAVDALPDGADPTTRLIAAANTFGALYPHDAPDAAARRLLGIVPVALRPADGRATDADDRGDLAARLARVWRPRPPAALVDAVRRALVLTADHELATSTLAVRIAASVRCDPYGAFVAGLATMRGPLHGSAAAATHALLEQCGVEGADVVVRRELAARRRLAGFGHKIYRGEDPRFGPLLDAVRSLPDRSGRLAVLDDLLNEAGRAIGRRPNVDLGLGALTYVGGLPADAPLFTVARIAGWAAHVAEELDERPVRYRGLARTEV